MLAYTQEKLRRQESRAINKDYDLNNRLIQKKSEKALLSKVIIDGKTKVPGAIAYT